RCRPANHMTPEALNAIATISVATAIRAVSFGCVQRARFRCHALANPLEIVPMFLPFLLVVLRDVAEIVAFGMIESALVFVRFEVPGIPHFGDINLRSRLL